MNRFLTPIFAAFLLLAAGAGPARAQAARTLTPEESLALGLAHSRTLHTAEHRADEAGARYREARALRLPILGAEGAYQRLSSNVPDFSVPLPSVPGSPNAPTVVTVAPAVLNRFNLQLSVRQPLFTGFRTTNGIRSARHQAEAARLDADQAEADAAFEVRQAYWLLYKAATVEGVAADAVQQIEAHLADVVQYRERGVATDREVLAVQTRRSEVRLGKVEAASALRLAQLRLNHLTGLPLGADVRPGAEVVVSPPPAGVEALVAQALARRPALAAGERQLQALEAGIDAARAARYPQVFATGNYRYAQPNPYVIPPQDAFTGTWDAGLLVTMDLWSGGRTSARVQQAQARYAQAEEQIVLLREAIVLGVHRSYLALQHAVEAAAVAEQGLRAAEEGYRITQAQYRAGAALNTDVLDAEGALREARIRRQHALADYALARAGLDHALGLNGTEP